MKTHGPTSSGRGRGDRDGPIDRADASTSSFADGETPRSEQSPSHFLPDPEIPQFLTIREAARLLRVNPKTAYEWALERQLPGAFRLPKGHWRVCRERLLRYVRENSVASPGETER